MAEQPNHVRYTATADFSLLGTAFERTRAFMADLEKIFNPEPEEAPEAPLPPLIGIGGLKGHGKDALADFLVADHGYAKTFMSEPLTAAVSLIGPRGPWVRLDFDVYDGLDMHARGGFMRYADLVEAVGYTAAKEHRDAREYLQGLGTEVGRNMLGETVWVDIAEKKIREARAAGSPVVITGIRYENELELIDRLGGHTVWIHRTAATIEVPEPHPLTDAIDEALAAEFDVTLPEDSTATHSSETSLSAEQFENVIINDGSLDDLRKQARHLAEALDSRLR